MSLKVGIIGLPNVGKSTLFNALTSSTVEAANYPFATINPNKSIVNVPDDRVLFLNKVFKPIKTTLATIEFVDIAGLVKGASHGEGLGNRFLSHIRECDALIEVVRCFENPKIIHVEQGIDPKRDIEIIDLELIMADLETLNKRIGKVETKARVNKDKDSVYEVKIISFLKEHLEKGVPVRRIPNLSKDDREFVRKNYFLLTEKPLIYVANISDQFISEPLNSTHFKVVNEIANNENTKVIPISIATENELSGLKENEKDEIFRELGIELDSLHRVIISAYKLLGLETFFTVGKDEVRAWTFKKGMNAKDCAGIIHSDFSRGFIKAKIYKFDDLVKFGNELSVKEAGKMRIEGKDYLMNDGDVAFFKFNV
jgi:GTP-binding protein YchF